MKKVLFQKVIDISSYIGLCIWAVYSISVMVASNYVIQWQHYLGIIFLVTTGLAFIRHHQSGVLFLGLTLLLALVCVISFNVGLVKTSLSWTPDELEISIFWGNPIILLLLIGHFIISIRWYLGIGTKEYWTEFKQSFQQKSPWEDYKSL